MLNKLPILLTPWAETWRRLWGDGKKFRGANEPFLGKISDDHF